MRAPEHGVRGGDFRHPLGAAENAFGRLAEGRDERRSGRCNRCRETVLRLHTQLRGLLHGGDGLVEVRRDDDHVGVRAFDRDQRARHVGGVGRDLGRRDVGRRRGYDGHAFGLGFSHALLGGVLAEAVAGGDDRHRLGRRAESRQRVDDARHVGAAGREHGERVLVTVAEDRRVGAVAIDHHLRVALDHGRHRRGAR